MFQTAPIIISDLIFGIRKRFVKIKKASKFRVISEISLSEIGNIYNDKIFSKNHNIDFVIIDAKTKDIVFIIEIERSGKPKKLTEKKILECLTHIPTIQEAYIILVAATGKPLLQKAEIVNKKLQLTTTTAISEFVGYRLANSLVSHK